MHKNDLVSLSKIRIKEAKVLLNNKCFDGAYYLAGYSVECAIKACIAGQIKNHVVPDKDFTKNFYQHNLSNLISAAGLRTQVDQALQSNPLLNLNWAVVKDWSEVSRYHHSITHLKASDLITAITSRKNGILPWINKCI